jgi:outer membrane protein X
MNEEEKDKQKEWTDDDHVVFIPDKDMRAIERALHIMEQAQKVTIVAIAVLTMNVATYAQEKGDMAAGANFVLGFGDNFNNYGIGAKFQYNVMNPLRLEASFTYFLKKNYITMWDLGVNAHWLFALGDKINVYPLAGVGLLNYGYDLDLGLGAYGIDDSASATDFAFNFGGGIDFKLSEKLILNAELKYKLSGEWDRLLISAGLAYRF